MKAVRNQAPQARLWPQSLGDVPPTTMERIAAFPFDLLGVVGLAVMAACVVLVDAGGLLRVVLGILVVVFLPGYALTSALFPSTQGPDGVERIALGFALSLATIPLVALAIDYTPWTLSTGPILFALTTITVCASAISLERRRRLPVGERYRIGTARLPGRGSGFWNRQTFSLLGLALVAIGLGGAGAIGAIADRMADDAMTEFAIYNQDGEPQFYPREIVIGDPAAVVLSVVNREGETVTYDVVVAGAGVAVDPLQQITLADDEAWSGTVRFTVTDVGDHLPVRFELRRTDRPSDAEPYRTLQLVVVGTAPAGGEAG